MRLVLALILTSGVAFAQTTPPATQPAPAPAAVHPPTAAVDRLAQTNADLIDLLKKQQAVLEDIQFDRRLQSRQIQSLEERLQETLIENTQLKNKMDRLSAAGSMPNTTPQDGTLTGTATKSAILDPAVPPPAPAAPVSTLPPAPPETPGVPSWHRLFVLSGKDSRSTDLFQVHGRQWRVVWNNQDPDGKAYKNTSALFISAFPKDDTIPQKVSAKLGSGGDTTQLQGPGNYYLKIEASGGSWELAVEDFQ